MKKPKTIKYTDHVLNRMSQRQIKKEMVQRCVDYGQRSSVANSFHYVLDKLTVVLGKSDVTVVTTYFETESELARQ